MLEKGMYDSWKTQILLYIQGKENGEMLIDSIKNGHVKLLPEITAKDKDGVTDILHPQTLADLAQQEKFVTAAKQARDLHSVNFYQLYAFLKCNEIDVKESQGYAGSAGKNQASGARAVNTDGNSGANPTRVIGCYNCNDEGHISKQCTVKKRVKDSERFKDKMLLAQA
ncbi:retrovirus-related pol polyprotein from transposon TNT 1-94 [Tanacetum coccineum]